MSWAHGSAKNKLSIDLVSTATTTLGALQIAVVGGIRGPLSEQYDHHEGMICAICYSNTHAKFANDNYKVSSSMKTSSIYALKDI